MNRRIEADAGAVRLLMEQKAAALVRRDEESLGALIDPAFVYVNAKGTSFDKSAYLSTYGRGGAVIFQEQIIREIDVDLFPAFAVARLILEDRLRVGERTIEGRFRSLCVCRPSSGGWLWSAGQTMAAR